MLKFEYRALNLFDQIGIVQVAFEPTEKVIHLKDEEHIVWPDYVGTQAYKLSDGFWHLVQTLKKQYLFQQYEAENIIVWINQFKWLFYQQDKDILLFKGQEFKGNIQKNAKNNTDFLIFNEWTLS